jgi:hypothetical protein
MPALACCFLNLCACTRGRPRLLGRHRRPVQREDQVKRASHKARFLQTTTTARRRVIAWDLAGRCGPDAARPGSSRTYATRFEFRIKLRWQGQPQAPSFCAANLVAARPRGGAAGSAAGVADRAPVPEGAPSMRWRPAGQCRAGTTDRRGLGLLPQIATDRRGLSGRIGRCRAPGCLTAAARWQPSRGLPASAPVKPSVVQQKPG